VRHEGDPGVFCVPLVVTDDDMDALGHVSNVTYVRWVQDVARAHSEHVGYGYEAYVALGAVFVVRRHEIDYLKPAYAGDVVKLVTWVDSWARVSSIRKTRVMRDGVELARAATIWALVSNESGRPCRIPAEVKRAFGVEA
jgi:acyl-CoA thioester hydrolase